MKVNIMHLIILYSEKMQCSEHFPLKNKETIRKKIVINFNKHPEHHNHKYYSSLYEWIYSEVIKMNPLKTRDSFKKNFMDE